MNAAQSCRNSPTVTRFEGQSSSKRQNRPPMAATRAKSGLIKPDAPSTAYYTYVRALFCPNRLLTSRSDRWCGSTVRVIGHAGRDSLPADWKRLYVRAPSINDFARVPPFGRFRRLSPPHCLVVIHVKSAILLPCRKGLWEDANGRQAYQLVIS